MIPQFKPRPAAKVPALHPQWANVDLAEILSLPTAYLVIGNNNSTLTESGSLASERLWERGRWPGGSIGNTVKMVHACRAAGIRLFVGARPAGFRKHPPQTPMDKSQYDYWARGKEHWTDEQERWNWETVAELRELMQPEDQVIHYSTLGNIFLGTMLPNYLNMLGIRTVLVSGYHLEWCVEQATRACRDLGFMPIVVGDAGGCGREQDEGPTLERLNNFFAPVVSTDAAIALIGEGARRREARK